MKFLTKEFCRKARLLSLCDSVAVLAEAEVKNDELFDRLYKNLYSSFLKAETPDPNLGYSSFEKNIVENIFKNRLNEIIKLTKLLPAEILNEIADVRVFALGFVSKKVKDKLLEYKKENLQQHLQTIEKVEKENLNNAKNLPKDIDILEFNEILIRSFSKHRNDYVLTLDGQKIKLYSAEITEKEFKNVRTINLNIPHSGYCIIVYTELYYENGFYELHLLLDNRDEYETQNLCYLTVKCKDIKVI